MCPHGKKHFLKKLTVGLKAHPKYRQDTRRVCKICVTVRVNEGCVRVDGADGRRDGDVIVVENDE